MNFPDYKYTPAYVQKATDKELESLKREYARISRIINKRLETFEKHGRTDYEAYRYAEGKFIPVEQVTNKRELGRLLAEGHRFLTAKRSSFTAIQRIERQGWKTFQEHYGNIFPKGIDKYELWAFLNAARKAHKGIAYDSEQAVAIFNYLYRTGKTRSYEQLGTSRFDIMYAKDPVNLTDEEFRQFDSLFDKKRK